MLPLICDGFGCFGRFEKSRIYLFSALRAPSPRPPASPPSERSASLVFFVSITKMCSSVMRLVSVKIGILFMCVFSVPDSLYTTVK